MDYIKWHKETLESLTGLYNWKQQLFSQKEYECLSLKQSQRAIGQMSKAL